MNRRGFLAKIGLAAAALPFAGYLRELSTPQRKVGVNGDVAHYVPPTYAALERMYNVRLRFGMGMNGALRTVTATARENSALAKTMVWGPLADATHEMFGGLPVDVQAANMRLRAYQAAKACQAVNRMRTRGVIAWSVPETGDWKA